MSMLVLVGHPGDHLCTYFFSLVVSPVGLDDHGVDYLHNVEQSSFDSRSY